MFLVFSRSPKGEWRGVGRGRRELLVGNKFWETETRLLASWHCNMRVFCSTPRFSSVFPCIIVLWFYCWSCWNFSSVWPCLHRQHVHGFAVRAAKLLDDIWRSVLGCHWNISKDVSIQAFGTGLLLHLQFHQGTSYFNFRHSGWISEDFVEFQSFSSNFGGLIGLCEYFLSRELPKKRKIKSTLFKNIKTSQSWIELLLQIIESTPWNAGFCSIMQTMIFLYLQMRWKRCKTMFS